MTFTATCDLFDRFKDNVRYPDPVFRDFGAKTRFYGEVETVKCYEDNSRVKELLNKPGDNRVLVVDGGGSLRCALMGDQIAAAAARNGWAGVVIWGCVRDVAELAQIDLGIKALASIPRASTRREQGVINIPVQLPGVAAVEPGDVLFADEDGIVIVSPEQAAGIWS